MAQQRNTVKSSIRADGSEGHTSILAAESGKIDLLSIYGQCPNLDPNS